MNFDESYKNLIQDPEKWISSLCIVNRVFMLLDEVEGMGWKEFRRHSVVNMPIKLYKYFPNTIKEDAGNRNNYSLMALKNNTVFLSSPTDFDDVYDSDINISFVDYSHYRIEEYCKRCGIPIKQNATLQDNGKALLARLYTVNKETGDFSGAIVEPPATELKRLSNERFILRIKSEIGRGRSIEEALSNTIVADYDECIKSLKETFRISCFCTDPFSQLMWGGMYADCHRGFCIEYTALPNDERFNEILFNLYPVVYCKSRSEMAEKIARTQDEDPTDESIWDIYFHGALRKSIDWVFQNEWRLLLPKGMGKETGYCIPFFPITKVFLGNRMPAEKRYEIIEICKEKGIPYVGVKKSPDRFEMKECSDISEICNDIA